RRTQLAHTDSETLALPGQEVFAEGDAADQPSGLVAECAASPQGGQDLLLVLQLASLDRTLHLGSPEGPKPVHGARWETGAGHLDVGDACFLETVAARQEAQALIEALRAALGMQQHFMVAARLGCRHQGLQHLRAHARAAQHAAHRHAPHPGHPGRMPQQAA
ncbi:hypothetical protein KXX11_003757, partial [Aspergillus fumigatus]